jgi:hypothetical protein
MRYYDENTENLGTMDRRPRLTTGGENGGIGAGRKATGTQHVG